MHHRRSFLVGLLTASLVPKTSWADAGNPSFLSAARQPDGAYVLCGISSVGNIVFQIPLPGRGHAATAHPTRAQAVAFARRPGTFALVIDCVTGVEIRRLYAPKGRHFYGHGTYSAAGDWLFTTENDYENGQGRIGIWDACANYKRIGEISSGGIGPHDIMRLPGTEILVIANGGIDTHPDSGRTKLNLGTMRPNLSYVVEGSLIERVELDPEFHKNSIRHLAVARGGLVAFAMQWQGSGTAPPLVGLHQRGRTPRLVAPNLEHQKAMKGYVGSIAFSADKKSIGVTSSRGGVLQIFDTKSGQISQSSPFADISGISSESSGFLITTGTGNIANIKSGTLFWKKNHALHWDNHVVLIG